MGRSGLRLPGLTSAWPLALLAPVLVFIATSYDRSYHTDFWHHLARGRAIVDEGRLLDEDRFTYTVSGEHFQDANWLSQVIYYQLYTQGGLPLVQVVNSLVLAAVFLALVYLCARAGRSMRVTGPLAAFAFFGMWQVLVLRPQTFSLLLFVLLYGALLASRHQRSVLILPPVIMAFWVNLHGGFPLGLVLIAAFLAAALWRAAWARGPGLVGDPQVLAMVLCLVASAAATLANPYGWRVYQYVGLTLTTAQARGILEWLPPGTSLFMSKLWIASVLLALAAFALPGRRPSAEEVFAALCFLAPTFAALRMMPWWLLVSMPIVAGQVGDSLPKSWAGRSVPDEPSPIWGVVTVVLLLAAVAYMPIWEAYKSQVLFPANAENPTLVQRYLGGPAQKAGLTPRGYQTEANLEEIADHLRDQESGTKRIFTHFEWGEYLGWALSPDGYTIFVDGRIEIYPDNVWSDYLTVTNARPGWQEVLDHYQVDWLVLDTSYHQETGLLPAVEKSAAWQRVQEAGNAVLFHRQALPANGKEPPKGDKPAPKP